MSDLSDPWEIICERAGLEDMRRHGCRHSYACRALALGESPPMIGRLLGHTQVETTARYAHLAQESVRDSAIRVAESIAGDLLQGIRAVKPSRGSGVVGSMEVSASALKSLVGPYCLRRCLLLIFQAKEFPNPLNAVHLSSIATDVRARFERSHKGVMPRLGSNAVCGNRCMVASNV